MVAPSGIVVAFLRSQVSVDNLEQMLSVARRSA